LTSFFLDKTERLLVIAFAILLYAIVGYDRRDAGIVGKWRSGDSSAMVWEFAKDGSVLMEA